MRLTNNLLFFFILILSLYSQPVQAQSCQELETWTRLVEHEFPSVESKSVRSGSLIYNSIRFNLLSDKYFIPVFGKPFEKVGKLKKFSIKVKLTKCKKKPKFPVSKRLDWYMWGVFSQERAYNDAVKEVVLLRQLRNELPSILTKINSPMVTNDDLEDFAKIVETKFQRLLPSEINKLEKAIEKQYTIASKNQLTLAINSLKKEEASFDKLMIISKFKTDNELLLKKLDQDTRHNFFKKLAYLKTKTISELVELEEMLLPNISAVTFQDYAAINTIIDRFTTNWYPYSNLPRVEKLRNYYFELKTLLIAVNHREVIQQIINTNTLQGFKNTQEAIFKYTFSSDQIILDIKSAIVLKYRQLQLLLRIASDEVQSKSYSMATRKKLLNSVKQIQKYERVSIEGKNLINRALHKSQVLCNYIMLEELKKITEPFLSIEKKTIGDLNRLKVKIIDFKNKYKTCDGEVYDGCIKAMEGIEKNYK
ncbi:MAG: hypothetical protein V3V28_02735 [Polaribacter sp.]|uniref:hypothetical protein n=1 Tax=Polaribacter sp. TaxID=1920175 RepID=UPI002F35FF6E